MRWKKEYFFFLKEGDLYRKYERLFLVLKICSNNDLYIVDVSKARQKPFRIPPDDDEVEVCAKAHHRYRPLNDLMPRSRFRLPGPGNSIEFTVKDRLCNYFGPKVTYTFRVLSHKGQTHFRPGTIVIVTFCPGQNED